MAERGDALVRINRFTDSEAATLGAVLALTRKLKTDRSKLIRTYALMFEERLTEIYTAPVLEVLVKHFLAESLQEELDGPA